MADRLRKRDRLNAEDTFDAECSTLPRATREALIGAHGANDLEPNSANPQPQQGQQPDDGRHDDDDAPSSLHALGAKTPILPSDIGTDYDFKRQIVWSNAIGFLVLHLCCLYGCYLTVTGVPDWKTTLYAVALVYLSGLGVTMGAHRLWSHRSFKAHTALKIVLLWLHTLAGQNCLYVWVRDHRQHHKYSDTDADPHNANRGFFFSHVGWLMARKHPLVIEYGRKIDMSDLEADPWIMFQKRHYKMLYLIFSVLLPIAVPMVLWNERTVIALFTVYFARSVIQLNATWLVNSLAHLYGTRPFDKTILPVQSMFVSFFSVGEGWHNYHHAFPWDYRASELGTPLNLTGCLIDILARFGLVYDRKEASRGIVEQRVRRTGDESHAVYGTAEGRRAFRTLFNLWPHPANPTYTMLYRPASKASTATTTTTVDASPSAVKRTGYKRSLLDKLSALVAVPDGIRDMNNNKDRAGNGALDIGAGATTATNKRDLNMSVDEALMVKLG